MFFACCTFCRPSLTLLCSKHVWATCEELLYVLRIDIVLWLLYNVISCDLPATCENICEQRVFSCETTVCDVAASECSILEGLLLLCHGTGSPQCTVCSVSLFLIIKFIKFLVAIWLIQYSMDFNDVERDSLFHRAITLCHASVCVFLSVSCACFGCLWIYSLYKFCQ